MPKNNGKSRDERTNTPRQERLCLGIRENETEKEKGKKEKKKKLGGTLEIGGTGSDGQADIICMTWSLEGLRMRIRCQRAGKLCEKLQDDDEYDVLNSFVPGISHGVQFNHFE